MDLMKLTESELKCLRVITTMGNARVSAIATATQAARPNVSRALTALQDKGFVETERKGLTAVVTLSETKHAVLWRKLSLEFAHMPLDRLLAGARLEVLATICCLMLRNRREIAENAVVSEASVALALERFKQVGIVQKIAAGYRVSPRFQTLAQFVNEYRHYLNQRMAQEFATDAVILWECNHEFIIQSKRTQEADNFQLTGPSSFVRFGIALLAPASNFFYSPMQRKLRLEDAILHALLVPNKSILPILLVWKKNEHEIALQYIMRQARKYNAIDSLGEIITYFEAKGSQTAEGFPRWDEFVLRAREYGIP